MLTAPTLRNDDSSKCPDRKNVNSEMRHLLLDKKDAYLNSSTISYLAPGILTKK